MEDMKIYFGQNEGVGVLSTSNQSGEVNGAIFSRPHCMEDGTIAFIMPERLSYANLSDNPHAHYLFLQEGPGYKGKRLSLTKVAEEKDTERLFELRKREGGKDPENPRHLVFFRIEKELPLLGVK
ncbi:MAG: pyridoxamine 5'-phosphate oxidase family protein [Desulfatibacillum sp.]|nr:pyridoxamine 5'-phosphate oxidase family protein [Desulfatibacillum sp.]